MKSPTAASGLLALAFSEPRKAKKLLTEVRASNTSSSYHYKLNSLGLAELTGIIKQLKNRTWNESEYKEHSKCIATSQT